MHKAQDTIARLKKFMAERGDLPAVSSVLARIVNSMKGDDLADEKMVDVVLSDFALSQKVLRLANSAMYSAFGGAISTISMAIYILGTETVGHLALGLKLIDNLGQAAHTERAKEELSKAILAGMISKKIGTEVSGKESEALAVATLLRSLGKSLVCFYLPEDFEVIDAKAADVALEEQCCAEVLGLTYGQIAKEVVTDWGFPADLASKVSDEDAEPGTHASWVQAITGYARHYVGALSKGADAETLASLAERFADRIGTSSDALQNLAHQAVQAAQNDEVQGKVFSAFKESSAKRSSAAMIGASNALAEGVAEIRRTLETLPVSRVVSASTEVLWRGLQCESALFFLRTPAESCYSLILGHGPGVQQNIKKLRFEQAFSPNVVHVALNNCKTIYIQNAREPNIAKRIPAWLREAHRDVGSLLVIPLGTPENPFGVMCLDWGVNEQPSGLTTVQMEHVEALRQMVTHSALAARKQPARAAA